MRIRPVEIDDRASLFAISLATGLAGADASHLYKDSRLMGLIYSAPYAQLEPELALVVEDDAGVCGFVVGVADTRAWEARLEREWWPSLRVAYPRPLGPSSHWSADQRRCAMFHSPGRTPESVTQRFPAHVHLNLLPRIQGRGIGATLFNRWLALARQRRVKAVHVGVNYQNDRAVRFWTRCGFQTFADGPEAGRTIWLGRLEAPL